jgi:hypothetical protein
VIYVNEGLDVERSPRLARVQHVALIGPGCGQSGARFGAWRNQKVLRAVGHCRLRGINNSIASAGAPRHIDKQRCPFALMVDQMSAEGILPRHLSLSDAEPSELEPTERQESSNSMSSICRLCFAIPCSFSPTTDIAQGSQAIGRPPGLISNDGHAPSEMHQKNATKSRQRPLGVPKHEICNETM